MKCIVKCMLLIMCLFFLTSAFSQKRYGIGENCITINSIKFGKILMKTIGEDRLRELIKKKKYSFVFKIESHGGCAKCY
jgi:hypothetical protein